MKGARTDYFECNKCGNCCPHEGQEKKMAIPFTVGDFFRVNATCGKGKLLYHNVVMNDKYLDLMGSSSEDELFLDNDMGTINVAMPIVLKECMFYDRETSLCKAFGKPWRYIHCLPSPGMAILDRPASEEFYYRRRGSFFRCSKGKIVKPEERKGIATLAALAQAESAMTKLLSPFVPRETEGHQIKPEDRNPVAAHFLIHYYLNRERRATITNFLKLTSAMYFKEIGFRWDPEGYEEVVPKVDLMKADLTFDPRQRDMMSLLLQGFSLRLTHISEGDL